MKRKGICRLWALLLTAVLCITAFSVTAFACENPENGDFDAPAEETEAEVPTLPEDFQSVIGNIDLEGLDLSAIRDAILSLLGGAGDTPETSEPPLTPDGNLTLIDDIGSDRTGGKQFITVQTRKGETYYLVIDYDKPIDEEADIYETYFLNLVDDRDLLALLSEDEKPTPTPTAAPTPTPTKEPVQTDETEPKQNGTVVAGTLMLAILGGGAFWYLNRRKKKESKPQPSYDEYEDDEDDETGDDDLNE